MEKYRTIAVFQTEEGKIFNKQYAAKYKTTSPILRQVCIGYHAKLIELYYINQKVYEIARQIKRKRNK